MGSELHRSHVTLDINNVVDLSNGFQMALPIQSKEAKGHFKDLQSMIVILFVTCIEKFLPKVLIFPFLFKF